MTLDGVEDESSMHASCPVIRGEKWTATKWLHTEVFKAGDGAASVPNTCTDKQDMCGEVRTCQHATEVLCAAAREAALC
jgi:hypothetical protein